MPEISTIAIAPKCVEIVVGVVTAATSVQENKTKEKVHDTENDKAVDQSTGVSVHIHGLALGEGVELGEEGALTPPLRQRVLGSGLLQLGQHGHVGPLLL